MPFAESRVMIVSVPIPSLYQSVSAAGGEDDDISLRVRSHGFNITRYPTELARYKMIKHGSDPSNPANPIRFDLLKSAAKRFTTDGLSNLKYTVVNAELRPLYTWLLVDIGSPKR